MIKKIKLTKGYEAIVDNKDFIYLSKFKWCWSHGYAIARLPKGKGLHMRMHRLITQAKEDELVDHINMDTLDNRRINLRICTKSQNMRNRGKQKNNTSGYKGIGWDKERNRWKVQLSANDKNIMKRFKELEDAMRFYQELAGIYHRDFARADNYKENVNIN